MSLKKKSEADVLKEELNFLTDLLQKHKTRGAYYQRSQLYSAPYSNSNVYKTKCIRNTDFSTLNLSKSKCHGNIQNFSNSFSNKLSSNFSKRNYSCMPTPVSVLPCKQNVGCSAKQPNLWKCNKVPSPSFEVKTSSSLKVVNTSSSNINTSSTDNVNSTKFGSSAKLSTVSGKDHSQSLGENDAASTKPPKNAKVTYLSCSDCVIEISEYENGELHIIEKKNETLLHDNKKPKAFCSIPPGIKIPESHSNGMKCEELATKGPAKISASNLDSGKDRSAYSRLGIGSDSSAVSLDCSKQTENSCDAKADVKLAGMSPDSKKIQVSPACNLKSELSCARNAKYSKINVSTAKLQNSVAKQLLKNKYCVKKSNLVKYNSRLKCKINREVKKCIPHPVKYSYVSKSPSLQKCLINYATKTNISVPVKSVDRKMISVSHSHVNSKQQIHTRKVSVQNKTCVTKSVWTASSYAKLPKKSRVLHQKNAFKLVNKCNPSAGAALKSSPLCKALCEKNVSNNHVLSSAERNCGKKWLKNDKQTIEQCGLNAAAQQDPVGNHLPETKMLCCSQKVPHKTSNYELKNVLNRPEIISCHRLQRVPEKKGYSKKLSLTPSPKSFSDSYTPSKRTRKVRVSKTAYKVVNRHANHVSQVVQMIKTKYKTVNKRSASNSHLKWLQEQKNLNLLRKHKKSSNCQSKPRWAFHSSEGRKHPVLHSKTLRKYSVGQNKAVKRNHSGMYKVSKTQINKSFIPKITRKSNFTLSRRKNSVIVNARGTSFQMSLGGKSLKRLGMNKENKTTLRKKNGGFMYIRQSPGCLVRNSSVQNIASRMLHRSINTVRAAEAKKTLQKSNVFCMFFNRFGRCNKGGDCSYIHDPSKIAVCTRFLRGTCKISGCPFSHEVSPGKMAICSFFLQGNCTNSSCPYQHTSIKPGTKLCKAFVKGYCQKGSECQDAHILACPQFICEGICRKGSSCEWPHPPVKNSAKKGVDSVESDKETQKKDAVVDDIGDLRYFAYEPGAVSDKCVKVAGSVESSTQYNGNAPKIRNKITFAKQPEFIPL